MYTGIYISPIQVRLFLISACNTNVYDRFILKAYYEVKNKDKNTYKKPQIRGSKEPVITFLESIQ